MNKILDATKNYRYYIIHNGKESRKDKLELAMEVAVGKKYNWGFGGVIFWGKDG